MLGNVTSKKTPGISLAENLERLGVFNLMDMPSNFNGLSFINSFKITLITTLKIIKYLKSLDKGEIFFYNFPKAYIYYYFLIKIFGVKTSLFMADGDNCIGLKHYPILFHKMFSRIVHLHYAGNDLYKNLDKPTYWFPGVLNKSELINFQVNSKSPKIILYNSSIKTANDPHLLCKIAFINRNIQFYCTSNFDEFIDNWGDYFFSKLSNIHFIGELNGCDYRRLLKSVDGILLIRNEMKFENKYNFPSKLLEAISFGKTIFSVYEIGGVPKNIYINCQNTLNLKNEHNVHMTNSIIQDNTQFLEACNIQNLIKWININDI